MPAAIARRVTLNGVREIMKKAATVLAASVVLAGCASSPEKINAAYVSPLQYKDYSCDQMSAEMGRVTRRANELQGTLAQTANNDAVQMGVGLVLFWPALFFLEGGDGPQAAEFARLKGERDAIEQASILKSCMISVPPLAPIATPVTPAATPPG